MANGRQRLTDEIRLGRIVIQYSNSHSTPQIEVGSSIRLPRLPRAAQRARGAGYRPASRRSPLAPPAQTGEPG
ncbi:hypothetical protein BconGalA64_39880 [Burkholderia contaminans]|nr:hypothetical protein BconGalA64_39880 [Burkholderia contaminans]